ncbi:MAG TPA: S1 RNA-binding domain-containing protein [Candidatus Angelobacter sp.]|jgi:small subunit ribosomal protein S1|nr:S1 RNA-binding domain-containing protein [Candidatus Angelobacter sp.]
MKNKKKIAGVEGNLKKIYTETIPDIQECKIYKGVISHISNMEAIVDIGFKSEGVIPLREFKKKQELKIGSIVEVMIEKMDYKGQCIFSHKKAKILKNWERINNSYEKDEIILGIVLARTKGGLIVKALEIECFLPGSHINVKPIRDFDQYVGKPIDVKVVKINKKTKNIVVSHKILMERDIEEQKKEIIACMEKGQVVEGTVKNITNYGVFAKIGGIDALIHITDMKWNRIDHPSELVEIGQKVKCVVLNVDHIKNRIQLGLKQLLTHPWDALDPNVGVGYKVKGVVTLLSDYGALVEIFPGIEGLIHTSEMTWDFNLLSAQDFLKIGDKVETIITGIDRKEKKMYLSIKRITPDPWMNIYDKYPINSKHTGIIHSFANFGVFVELEKGISGVVSSKDLTWFKKIKHPSEFCKKGDKMEVVILNLDVNKRRINLGHKQLMENTWDLYEKIYVLDSLHYGLPIEFFDKGATILLGCQKKILVEAFAPARFLEKNIKKNDKFKIIEFNKEFKRIIVSHASTATKTKNR